MGMVHSQLATLLASQPMVPSQLEIPLASQQMALSQLATPLASQLMVHSQPVTQQMVNVTPSGLVMGTVTMRTIIRNVSLMAETAVRIPQMLWRTGTCTAPSVNAWRTPLTGLHVKMSGQKANA